MTNLMKKGLPLLSLAMLSLTAISTAAADDAYWPIFHGPNGDNKSADTGLLKQWPEEGPELVWQTEGIGEGYSGVSIADGVMYTSGNIEEETVITALDMDGKILWQAANGPAWTTPYGGARATPTIDGALLYDMNPTGQVVCMDTKTGEKIWSLNILEDFEGEHPKWALSESMRIDGDNLICSPGGTKASVVALDKMTGKTVWETPSTGQLAGYASATLVEYQGLRIAFIATAELLIGVNVDNGDLLFEFEHLTKYNIIACKPIFQDGKVFISSGYGTTGSKLVQINVDGKDVTAEEIWHSENLDNQHGGVILVDGFLYGASQNFNRGSWICLDWETGEMKYAERGIGKGSATFAEGMLYMMSEKGAVGLAKATPDGHEVISEFDLPRGKGPTWAHPIVCGGKLYLRHDNVLYCYDVTAK